MFVCGYDAFVFTLDEFFPPDLDRERLTVIAQAIDPLTAKNRPLRRHLAHTGRQRVRREFLTARLPRDDRAVYGKLLRTHALAADAHPADVEPGLLHGYRVRSRIGATGISAGSASGSSAKLAHS